MSDAAEFKTACAVLGLRGTVSARDAKAALRLRAALLHPDVHHAAGDERTHAATAAMQQLNDAYQLVLGTLEKDRSTQTAEVDPATKLRRPRVETSSTSRAVTLLPPAPDAPKGFALRHVTRNHRDPKMMAPIAKLLPNARVGGQHADDPGSRARHTGRVAHLG